MSNKNPTVLNSNSETAKCGGDPNKARNLPPDLPFGFNPSVPPPPFYQDVWNLNSVPLPFDSNQVGAPAPIRIKIFSRKNRPFPEPVHFYKLPEDQHASFNKYLHAPPEGYRHTLPPDPKIPKFGAPLLPKEPYLEPQYDVKEESPTQSIAEILFPEAKFLWSREAQKPIPKASDFEASLSSRQPQDGPNESQNVLSPDFDSMHNIDTQEPKRNVSWPQLRWDPRPFLVLSYLLTLH